VILIVKEKIILLVEIWFVLSEDSALFDFSSGLAFSGRMGLQFNQRIRYSNRLSFEPRVLLSGDPTSVSG
jgi:hypothetical protein